MQWKYNPKNLTVAFPVQPGYDYEVDLERCRSSSEALEWFYHLSEKRWASPSVLCEFLWCVDSLLNVRNARKTSIDVKEKIKDIKSFSDNALIESRLLR